MIKKICMPIILFFIMPLLISSYTAGEKGAGQEIERFLTAWHLAAAKSDIESYFGAMSDDFVFLGTDVSERWTKTDFRQYAEPAFKRPSAWIFRAVRRSISFAAGGRIAWFDEDLESASFWVSRGSGVLEKINGEWKLKQYVLSFTIPNAAVRDVKPIVLKFLAGTGIGEKKQ